DLVLESAGLPRRVGELLAPDCVAVLFLARDAVLRRAVLRGRRHRAAAMRVEERRPQRVLELSLPEAQAAPQTADDVRRLAHALRSTREHDVRFAELDHLSAADGRLNPRAAQP